MVSWQAVLVAELAVAGSGCVTFVVLFARTRWRSTREATQLMVMMGYLGGLIGLRIASFAASVPLWVWALAWAPLGPLIWRWTWLLLKARQERTAVGPNDGSEDV